MACSTLPLADPGTRWCELIAASRYDRELNRLIGQLERLCERLNEFAATDFARELLGAWRAAGNPPVNLIAPDADADHVAVGFLDEVARAQHDASGLAWGIATGLGALRSFA